MINRTCLVFFFFYPSHHLVARVYESKAEFRSALQHEKEGYTIYKNQVGPAGLHPAGSWRHSFHQMWWSHILNSFFFPPLLRWVRHMRKPRRAQSTWSISPSRPWLCREPWMRSTRMAPMPASCHSRWLLQLGRVFVLPSVVAPKCLALMLCFYFLLFSSSLPLAWPASWSSLTSSMASSLYLSGRVRKKYCIINTWKSSKYLRNVFKI